MFLVEQQNFISKIDKVFNSINLSSITRNIKIPFFTKTKFDKTHHFN